MGLAAVGCKNIGGGDVLGDGKDYLSQIGTLHTPHAELKCRGYLQLKLQSFQDVLAPILFLFMITDELLSMSY